MLALAMRGDHAATFPYFPGNQSEAVSSYFNSLLSLSEVTLTEEHLNSGHSKRSYHHCQRLILGIEWEKWLEGW